MGALTLAASLKRVNTSRKLAIMVTSEGWLVVNITMLATMVTSFIITNQACHLGHLERFLADSEKKNCVRQKLIPFSVSSPVLTALEEAFDQVTCHDRRHFLMKLDFLL